ncbi:hypothetical protein MMYC01_209467 [Madurella mycetomatis]|uniref:Uncharacterized protein n=1 Tax=Madurella mycetomatis TaxID=100816 RepID=A0A175VS28_9PEZI|nr:hypothetical protein MMYC01_209467 [Madurella mycetomatis]
MDQLDISLSYEEIDAFVANAASNPSIRSLSLRLTQPALTSYQTQDIETSNLQVEQTLLRLSDAIASLEKLQSFSLTVPPNSPAHHFDISRRAIAAIIAALTDSCVNLELDTASLDHAAGFGVPVHLCDTLRNVLPRMRHVRLSLRTMCASLVGTGDAGSFTPISLPNMQMLLVNCRQSWGTAPICAMAAQSASTPAVDSWDSVALGLQELAAADSGRLRPNAELTVLTSTPQSSNDKGAYITLVRAEVTTRTSQAFPVAFVSHRPDAWLMRMGEGREVLSPSTAALVAVAEGETWVKTTSRQVRLPRALAAEWGLETEQLPLEEVGVWRAANPKKMHLLWYNEALSGVRLLDSETRSGDAYLSREPLVEMTLVG